MAFVFRSEKKISPPPLVEAQEAQALNEGESKGEKPSAVCKGLPHLLQKQAGGSEKENCLPDIEAHPIHSPSALSFNATVFKSREFNDAKISQFVSGDGPSMQPVLTIKEISQKKVPSAPAVSINRINSTADCKSAKTVAKIMEEKPHIINKNLLKTMLHMSQKCKETLEIDKIAINESKEADSSLKKFKLKGWRSLKRLSPLKEYRDFSKLSQTAETDDINISYGQRRSKPDGAKAIQKLERAVIVKAREADQKESSQEDEYLQDATPGPGAYSYQPLKNKKQFRSKRTKFQKIFYSQIERFQGHEKKFQEVTYINDEAGQKDGLNKSSSSACQSFLSKSPKFKESEEGISPPPGYYDTRQTLEHDLVRHILKSSNTTTFINRSPRAFKVQGENLPGPGAYTLDRSFEKLLEERDKFSYSYKSQLQRQLQHSPSKEQEATKLKGVYNASSQANSVIHVKEDAVLENYYITEAPAFMSSTDRFPKLKTLLSNQRSYQKNRENVIVPSPPKQAFNSSEKRETFGKVGEGVGIGLYNLNKDIWCKKSYNVLFN